MRAPYLYPESSPPGCVLGMFHAAAVPPQVPCQAGECATYSDNRGVAVTNCPTFSLCLLALDVSAPVGKGFREGTDPVPSACRRM